MEELLAGPIAIGHLLRRAGFGPDEAQWESFRELAFGAAVEKLLEGLDAPVDPDPEGFDAYAPGAIQDLWLERMVKGANPLAEKLALFWHGHFATSNAKVEDPQLMWNQYALFRGKGAGRFEDLVLGLSRDVAMVRWLDGTGNRKGTVNENYARELQELFTLGVGNYTEQDIREIARAFTGWNSRHHSFLFQEQFHDDGEKTFHGHTGRFDGADAVRILTGLPACSRFICGKLIRFFSHPNPTETEVESLAKVFRAADGNIKTTLGALFLSPGFRMPASYRALVKSPVEFFVGALRATGLQPVPQWVHGSLDRMGQILFRPPSVKGWTSGTGWLSSAAVVERLGKAQVIAHAVTEPLAAPERSALADRVLELAFQGDVPPKLAAELDRVTGPARITMTLGCPEFQLA